MTPDTWYPAALAEKLTRQDIVADPNDPFEIYSLFNSELASRLPDRERLVQHGHDNREPSNRIDLLVGRPAQVGHRLGFSVGRQLELGALGVGLPLVLERYMLDASNGKSWIDMTNAERARLRRNNLNLSAGQKAPPT